MPFKRYQTPKQEIRDRIVKLEDRAEKLDPADAEPMVIRVTDWTADQDKRLAAGTTHYLDRNKNERFTLWLGTPGQ
jgi:hypothetical protein